jgi:hypothetical protein
VRAQAPDRSANAGEGFGEPGQQHARRGGQLDRSVEAMKQTDAEIGFEGMDLMADRRRRHVELFGRLAEAHMPGGRLESAQRTQGWKMACRHENFSIVDEQVSFVEKHSDGHIWCELNRRQVLWGAESV